MGKIVCSNCKNALDAQYLMTCHTCGSVLCDRCAAENGLSCSNCYSGLNYYN
ncbi:MAG TPA: hypothetical protein VIL23_01260 [Clostridia bacterium]